MKLFKKRKSIQANQIPSDKTVNLMAEVDISAAAEGDEAKPRTFSMNAYTGGLMRLSGWFCPVVVDLKGLKFKAPMSMLVNHKNDPDWVAGIADNIEVQNNQLLISGGLLAEDVTPAAAKVAKLAKAKVQWQASIGAETEEGKFVPGGKKITVNGKSFDGPLYCVQRSRLRETSFVILGADFESSANVAAKQTEQTGDSNMEFSEWLLAKGFDVEAVMGNDGQRKILEASWKADVEGGTPPVVPPIPPVQGKQDGDDSDKPLEARVAEMERVSEVRRICAGFPDVEAEAVKESWTPDVAQAKVEAAKARSDIDANFGMPNFSVGGASDAPNPSQVLEASLCISAGLTEDEVGESYQDRVVDAAVSDRMQGAGLSDLIFASAASLGVHIAPGRLTAESIRAVMEANRSIEAAGVTTLSLPGIMSNVASKRLQKAYNAVPSIADKLSNIATPSDLKKYTVYSLFGDGTVQPVGADGKLKHISLQETSYDNQAHTEGGIMVLTEDMMLNDDLGAFMRIPATLGRACFVRKEKAFFEALLGIASFFTADNDNYIEGSDSAFSISSLTLAAKQFMLQVDPNDDPINVMPKYLLTTVGDFVPAGQIFTDKVVNETTTANKPKPESNPHVGKFEPLTSPYMDTTKVNGAAVNTSHWLMLADPNDVPVMEMAYVRGQRKPRIERGAMDFDQLAIGFRCVFRFGVSKADHRGGIYSKGKA